MVFSSYETLPRDDFARLVSLGYNTLRLVQDQCNRGPNCFANIDRTGLNSVFLDITVDIMLNVREEGGL